MARVAGVDLPRDKKLEYALPYIYGIGLTRSREILTATGINGDIRVRDLSESDIGKLREVIERQFKVEGDLRREISQNVRRLIEIGSYRGIRHRRGLPCRGQRTRSNARIKKGPRRAVAGKKKATK